MIKTYYYIYHMDHMGEHNSSLCNFDAKLVILTYRGMSQVNHIVNLLILKWSNEELPATRANAPLPLQINYSY